MIYNHNYMHKLYKQPDGIINTDVEAISKYQCLLVVI